MSGEGTKLELGVGCAEATTEYGYPLAAGSGVELMVGGVMCDDS